ncbi:hypothetical protein [Macrococcus capreoli]|uniref:hypothetical protein n=1 Tax=Macrococcus capreoli TaxID=2982690 RepID=UPI003EE75A30
MSENKSHVMKEKYEKIISNLVNENKKMVDEIHELKSKESDKFVVNMSDDEKEIREKSNKFIKVMFEMEKNESFNSKKDKVSDYITDELSEKLFSGKDKFNIATEMTIDNVHIYFDQYKKGQSKYNVLVRFDQHYNDKAFKDKKDVTSELELVNNNGKWLISSFDLIE